MKESLQNSFKSRVALPLALWFAGLALHAAQPPNPHIGYVYPAGGRQGSTFQVIVGGQRLDDPTEAIISGEGLQARVVEYNRPMTQKQFNDLRDELRGLQEKRRATMRRSQESTNRWSAVDEKKFAEIKSKILKNAPNRDGNPAIAENVILQMTLATNADFGHHEIRIRTASGLSNPVNFYVDNLPEFTARAKKAANPELERVRRFLEAEAANAPSNPDMRVTLPAVVNGQIMAGEVDRIHLAARKGQHLVAAVSARKLTPYLADAVPGWFQATLGLTDTKGKQLAYNDDFRFDPDPVLYCDIPNDGEYILEIKDAIYRGREDFVYRLTLGELPFVTSMFPLGGRAGTKTTVTLQGWNLPVNTLIIDATNNSPAVMSVFVQDNGRFSLPFAIDTLAETIEQQANNTMASAQSVSLPVIINGRIGSPGEFDFYRFEGRAGQEVVAEVRARRLASPLDSFLKLIDTDGKQLAFNDDCEDKACGLTVFALRKDGFTNEIQLRLKNNPAGCTLSANRIAADQDELKLTLQAPLRMTKEMNSIVVEGHSLIGETEIFHRAIPADEMMQAFFYKHLVIAKDLQLAILRRQGPGNAANKRQ